MQCFYKSVRLQQAFWAHLGASHGARVPLPLVWKLMFVASITAAPTSR